ncbi:SitI3 family protein [Saccharothrix stipae]
MSISYSLALATPLPAAEVADALREVGVAAGLLDPATDAARLLGENAATTRGTWLRVVADEPEPWNPLPDVLGATPTVLVVFGLAKTDIGDQQDDVVRLVAGVLAKVPDDAVLHHDYEVVWLVRRAGALLLNERDDLWPSHRLALLHQPYRRETQSFPED